MGQWKADKNEVIKRVKEMVKKGEISKSHRDPVINSLYPKKTRPIKKRDN